jgi:RNA polymerase sigma-70 factor (ECF subfamily)
LDDTRFDFNDIVRLMTRRLVCVARYYLQDGAEDAVADVWERVWERRYLLDEVENVPAWLVTVTRRHCIDVARREGRIRARRAPLTFDEYAAIAGDDYDPERCYLAKERAAILARYVNDVREIYGLPLKLYYYDRMSVRSIADLLGISENAVKQRLYAGRKKIKKLIEGEVKNG